MGQVARPVAMVETDNTSRPDLQALARLLAWYQDMGATGVIDVAPSNWHGKLAPGANFAWPQAPSAEPILQMRHQPAPGQSSATPAAPAAIPRDPDAVQDAARDLARTPSGPARTVPTTSSRPPASPAPATSSAMRPSATRSFDPPPRGPKPVTRVAPPLPVMSSLSELADALQNFDGCGLKATAKKLVLYRGAERARVMIVGEAPGREEDAAGRPFVGAAGRLLDRMLAAIDLSEADVHIAHAVYWRPPGNRNPTPSEVAACAPFLDRQIAIVQPDVLFVLGDIAAKSILKVDGGITKIRGQWRDLECGGRRLKLLPSLHPTYLLQTPAAKRLAWLDLLALRAMLDAGTVAEG